jgi:hypothetical protein
MVNLYSELADIGEEMKDKHFAVIILKSLPASWDSVATQSALPLLPACRAARFLRFEDEDEST